MTMVENVRSGLLIGAAPRGEEGREPWFLDPREILRTVRLRWLTVLLPVLLCLGAAAAWTQLNPPQYAASTQILIDPRGLQVVKDGLTPPDQASDASLLLVDSQLRVLTSDDVLGRAVDRLDLARDPEFQGRETLIGAIKGFIARLTGRTEPPAEPRLTALRILRDRVGARRLERSFVVELGVTSEDREKAARLARGIAETYLARDAATRSDTTRRAGEAIEGRLAELREALRRAEDKAQGFRAKHNIVGTRSQLVSEQQLTQLSDQLGAARAKALDAGTRLRQVEGVLAGGRSESVSEIVQNPTITALRGQLAGIERLRADAEETLGKRHPSYMAAVVQEKALRAAIEAEIRRIAAASRNDFEAAQASARVLASTLERRKADALKVGDDFVQLRELERQVEASRAVYEAFLVRARELQEQQRLDTSASRIISPASPPEKRIGPPTPVVFVAAVVAGLGLGLVGGLGLELLAGRVRSRRRLEGHLGRTGLDALPRAPRKAARPASLRADFGTARGDTPYEVALARLRHRLAAEPGTKPGTRSGATPLVVLVTAGDDRAGKSVLARSLALSAVADRERVILVDADPKGLLTRDLGAAAPRDLAGLLRARAPLGDALVTLPSGLRVLPRPSDLPRDLAGALADALLRSEADLVVVDLGLVGGDVVTERLIAEERIPVLLLAVSARRGRLAAVDRALKAIGPARRARVVVTDADLRE
ncbi:lipopolysaccharide biosynthesis protein [Methylobacterium currus]|uniref:Lipopolysaccharide biosynthesis protein n=1 Tax=Methylobacterium currus TaxID=2051553 RepID=A0A2R4WR47_9HYPH|nr:exopolysaccharide transport family protein [Methylobacterium currus]AWB24023.1 lipopolysaccharide biosynthesis protein [Methylobacterium currus]UHC15846.1 exopolysaccharide transport family protein [Methylobacterium currus]